LCTASTEAARWGKFVQWSPLGPSSAAPQKGKTPKGKEKEKVGWHLGHPENRLVTAFWTFFKNHNIH
jgi:hypothetical protein